MKSPKTISFALALALAGTALAGQAAVASAEESAPESVTLTTENAALFLPESYEQYLPLENPRDLAISEDYIVIADGNALYLYDRAQGSYSFYENTAAVNNTISKIQFAETGDLYFSDDSLNLYRFDPVTKEQINTNANSTTFFICKGVLYNAHVTPGKTTLSRYSISEGGLSTGITIENPPDGAALPVLAYREGELLCGAGSSFYGYDTKNWSRSNYFLAATGSVSGLSALCYFENALYYTSSEGFFRTDDNGNNVLLDGDSDYKALTVYNGELYCVKGSSVLKITVGDEVVPTSYEISSSSSSPNRLSGAVDCVRAGDLFITADAGNRRVSVYDRASGRYSTVTCPDDDFLPSRVASDGKTVAVSSSNKIYVFQSGDSSTGEAAFSAGSGVKVLGLACLYGEIYYVTDGNVHGKVGGTFAARGSLGTPAALTCDIYGDLFVSYQSGKVYAYNEETFLDSAAAGTEIIGLTLPADAVLRADFKGNLYALKDGVVTTYEWNEEEGATARPLATVGGGFVFSDESLPLSFALGYEDDEVYFCYGNYVVKSAAGTLDEIPSLDEIPVENARGEIFAPRTAQNLTITVPEKTVGFRTSLSQLKETETVCFPYRGYFRTESEKQGVLLARTQEYLLVAFFEDDLSYSVSVFRDSPDLSFSEGNFQETDETKYLSSDVSAYFAPALDAALGACRLSRGDRVRVTGYVDAPDYRYAFVTLSEDGNDDGNAGYFIPASFLTQINPVGTENDRYTLGYLKAGTELAVGDGEILTLSERTEAKLFDNGDGTYTARFTVGETEYAATVAENMIWRGETDALRIALIVILSVLALLIAGIYIWLRSDRKKRELK